MTRVRYQFAALLVGAGLAGGAALNAQSAPDLKPVLAGKKITPPVRGAADIDFVKGQTKREGTTLVTKIQVKNTSPAPIGRLKIVETWYDKSGGTIPGGEGVINGLLQPGEVQTVEIRTPVDSKMASSMFQFSHANGTIPKPHAVKSFDGAGEEKPAAGKKKG
jgi:hypothetical protein